MNVVFLPECSTSGNLALFVGPRLQQELNRLLPIAFDQGQANIRRLDRGLSSKTLQPEIIHEAFGLQSFLDFGCINNK